MFAHTSPEGWLCQTRPAVQERIGVAVSGEQMGMEDEGRETYYFAHHDLAKKRRKKIQMDGMNV